jgi:hypothetical protein
MSAEKVTTSHTIADPGPLGLAGFALTTFVLSMVNSGIAAGTAVTAVLGLALFYGGIAQLLAGMWEFVKGNTFGATAFTSYGAFWMAFWYLVTTGGDKGAGAVALFLTAWTIFTAYMTVAAMKASRAVMLVFVSLTITFLFLTLGAWGTMSNGGQIGGYFGLLTAALAWYASAAGVINSTWKKTVLPVG